MATRIPFRLTVVIFVMTSLLSNGSAESDCSDGAKREIARVSSCFERWEYGCTKLNLRPRIEQEPECAEALWVQSFLSEREANYPERDALRRRALKLNPKLSQWWTQRGLEDDAQLIRQDFEHFQVRFYGAEDRTKAWDAVKILNDMYNSMGSQFGVFPQEKIIVLVFNNERYLDVWRTRFHGGFFDQRDGIIRLRIDESPGGDVSFEHLARHEFVHAFLHAIGFKTAPLWFQEGVAEFYADKDPSDGFWVENRLGKIRNSTHFKPLKIEHEEKTWEPPLRDIEMDLKEHIGSLGLYKGVLTGEAMVLSVAKDRGESWIQRMIGQMQAGARFEACFQDVVGETPETVLEHFYKSCRSLGNYGQ